MKARSRGRHATLSAALLATISGVTSADVPSDSTAIAWAYPLPPPGAVPAGQSGAEQGPLSVPGSTVKFALPALRNMFAAPDWRPADHPAMPAVVAFGRKPGVFACGYCHLPTGDGRPENAALAGLPKQYIIDQMRTFASGTRTSSVPARLPTQAMAMAARAASAADVAAAADYFSSLKHRSFLKVVETVQVPKTTTMGWIYSRDPKGGSEALGARIIEMPVDFERFERRDPRIGYLAYVPRGSIAKGRKLAKSWGDGGQLACAACHGRDGRGAGIIPPLAGRSPTFIVRQLNDFRTGARGGPASDPMKLVTAQMRSDDMIALAAYFGSRRP